MADISQLFGSCACERNQYTVTIPRASSSQASVFFDNSAANRRYQAAPLTAWLRVPLDWFHSSTYAQYPDETHHSIRRTFYSPVNNPTSPSTSLPPSSSRGLSSSAAAVKNQSTPTRRQFCGYCGTHLTAWNESRSAGSADALDVTLGSLAVESLEVLRALEVIPDEDDLLDEEEREEAEEQEGGRNKQEGAIVAGGSAYSGQLEGGEGGLVRGGTIDDDVHVPTVAMTDDSNNEGLVKGGTVDDEDHIPTNEPTEQTGTATATATAPASSATLLPGQNTAIRRANSRSLHQMQHRGMPFFEEMVENSPLGRIRRQRGAHVSADGSVSQEWEVVEIDGSTEQQQQQQQQQSMESGGEVDGNTIMEDVAPTSAAPNKRLKTSR